MSRPTGPRPKPARLKLINGTLRPGRVLIDEPQLKSCLPIPPDHLSAAAIEEWHRVGRDLVDSGIITNVDRGMLALYCQAYARWVDAENALAHVAEDDPDYHGLLISAANGAMKQNPLVTAANVAMRDVARFATDLGLTPSSRGRVHAVGRSNDDAAARYFENEAG